MTRSLALVLLLSGCSRILGIDDFRAGDAATPPGDGRRDASPIVDGQLVDGFGIDGTSGCNPTTPFSAAQPITELNSAGVEVAARLDPTETAVFFERDGDIYTATRSAAAAAFTTPVPVPALATAPVSEQGPTLSFDEDELVYARDGELYSTTAPFTAIGSALANLNSASTEQNPHLGFMELWFVSDRSLSGDTSQNLFKARLNVVSDIYELAAISGLNTPDDEDAPVITFGGSRIYFASDRDGSFDLFTATTSGGGGAFTNVVKLTSISDPIKDERPTHISFDECRLYFSQDGDLYVATR